jgi:hypothetical protein
MREVVTLLNPRHTMKSKKSKKARKGMKRVSFYARRNGPEGGWGKGAMRWAGAALTGVALATALTVGLAYTDLSDGAQDGILAGAGLILGGAGLAFGYERFAAAAWAAPTSVAAVRAVVRTMASSQTASIRDAALRAIAVSQPGANTPAPAPAAPGANTPAPAPAAPGATTSQPSAGVYGLPMPAGFAVAPATDLTFQPSYAMVG